MDYYIKEDYYFDVDKRNQLRITGPENHLFLGVTFPEDVNINIVDYYTVGKQLEIKLELPIERLKITIPLVTDIRTLRSFIEPKNPKPTYQELINEGIKDVTPHLRKTQTNKGNHLIKFINSYTDERERVKRYGVCFILPKKYKINLSDNTIEIEGEMPLNLKVRTISNIVVRDRLQSKIFMLQKMLPLELFSPILIDFYKEAERNISFLIRTKKTSSFEYGTIFPRDWIESADLGFGDLTEETVDYMYSQSMQYVSEKGEGWHENIVGEYKAKVTDPLRIIDRKMIDIEPHYIMGMERVSKKFLTRRKNQKKMRLVSDYLLEEAKNKDLITFKRMSNDNDKYYFVGNWRDGLNSYPQQKSPLAPYDVNCVFYPVSLKIIHKYKHFFRIKNEEELVDLQKKWDGNKQKFRLYHHNDIVGYSLALHSRKNIPLPIMHLDECYDLFYDTPSMEEVVSFAQKLIDPDFFYTPVGPILVDVDEEMFTTKNYHGKVIWPKQAAFAVAGLSLQYKRGLQEEWPKPVLENLKESIAVTSRACFKGWMDLGTVPELYYYDAELDKARFYTDQEGFDAQMSLVQLWSSVGARRIMRDYAFIMTGKEF